MPDGGMQEQSTRTEAKLDSDPFLEEVLENLGGNVLITGAPNSGKSMLASHAATIAAYSDGINYGLKNRAIIPMIDLQGYDSEEYEEEIKFTLEPIYSSDSLPPVLVIDELSSVNLHLVEFIVKDYTEKYQQRYIGKSPKFIFVAQMKAKNIEQASKWWEDGENTLVQKYFQPAHKIELESNRFENIQEDIAERSEDLTAYGKQAYTMLSYRTDVLQKSLGDRFIDFVKIAQQSL